MTALRIGRRDVLLGAAALAPGMAAAQPAEAIAANVLETSAENQAATFRNMDRSNPVRTIRRGAHVLPLPPHARNLDGLNYDFAGAAHRVEDFMARNRTGGLMVLKGGRIALERYGMGNTPTTRWTSFSTAKSMNATLAGAALRDGAIRSLDDPVERYLPALKGSAYEGVSVRNVMRMCSGVAWTETYVTTGDSDIARLSAALASRRKGALMELMRTRPRAAPQGTKFNYSTGEACLLGWIVAAATGQSLADYYSQKIWSRVGMEADGYWQLEAPGGLETSGMGVSARLRDYARFGQFILEDGVAAGRRVLPVGWRDLAGHPDIIATAQGRLEPGYPLGYGYQWWALPRGAASFAAHDGAFTAEGIFGQFIYVHPREQVVAVVWSAWRSSWENEREMETYALLGAAIRALA